MTDAFGLVAWVVQLAHATTCPSVPPLSYAPQDVGWPVVPLVIADLIAGVACVGVVGSLLRWSADDHAPLRRAWMALIMLGFAASAAGIYVAFANRAHAQAVNTWLLQAGSVSQRCLASQSTSPNLMASTIWLSVELGLAGLVLIMLGVGGAVIERRQNRSSHS